MMPVETFDPAMLHVLLTAQRANVQALLMLTPHVPEAQRMTVRAGAIQALGAIEDALGVPRTFPTRAERHRARIG